MKISSFNLTPRAEETEGHEWRVFSNLPIPLTKIPVPAEDNEYNIFINTYFFNFFYIISFVLHALPWKDKCRCIHILWRLKPNGQVKTDPTGSSGFHGRCSNGWITGHCENLRWKKLVRCTPPQLTVNKVPTLWTSLSSLETLRTMRYCVCVFFNKGYKSSKYCVTMNLH